jgi:hypothetical protein
MVQFFTISLILITSLCAQEVSTSLITYDPTDDIFPNPERGFSAYRSSKLSLSFIQDLRSQNVTVIQRIYTIPQFNNSALSQSFLDLVDFDLNTAREGGAKLVLRFSYTNDQNGADAPLDTILMHIDQLGPLFQEHYDVINYIEAGFIGAWGEWYYSSNGLNNTTARRAVLFKELSVLPVDRAVVVRTPSYKRDILNDTTPLTPDSAFSGSYRARTGAHNDCFLASATDYGTYNNIEVDKSYLNQDNRYVPQGGETCNPSVYSGCDNALVDLARMRWSVLNKDYHPTVLNGWETEGCMNDVKRRLGYRFSLLQAIMPDSVKPGGEFELNFDIINYGFASPYNLRNLEIILRNEETKERYFLIAEDDPRMWMAGDTAQVTILAGLPQNIPPGSYQVLLHLSDPVPALHDRSEYAIRLANTDTWEDSTGYNSLLHSLIVNVNASGDNYTGDVIFKPIGDHPTGVIYDQTKRPSHFQLKGNYPNPFNGSTVIQFDLNKASDVKMDIININGKMVTNLIEKKYQPGSYKILWEPGKLSSGTYIYQLTVDGLSQAGRALYIK